MCFLPTGFILAIGPATDGTEDLIVRGKNTFQKRRNQKQKVQMQQMKKKRPQKHSTAAPTPTSMSKGLVHS